MDYLKILKMKLFTWLTILYSVVGFIARSLKKRIKCEECSNILGNNEEISMPMVVDIPEDYDSFLNSIDRGGGGVAKPSDLTFLYHVLRHGVFIS